MGIKLNTQKSKRKKVLSILVLCIIAGVILYYIFVMNGSLFGWQFRKEAPSETANLNTPTDEEIQAGEATKQQAIENESSDDRQTSSSLTVGFTALNQNEDSLQIRTVIQEVVANGICTLTLTKDSQTVTKTAPTYPTASVSTCQGFDVPVSELSSGTWNVKIEVSADGKTGQATTTTQIN